MEHPSVSRIRANAIAGLQRWVIGLAKLEQNRENAASAHQHMNTLKSIERWRSEQKGFLLSMWHLFTKDGREPLAKEMMDRVQPLLNAFDAAGDAYQQITGLTAAQLVAQWDTLKPHFESFYTNMQFIIERSKYFLLETYPEGEKPDLDALHGNIFDAEEAYNTPLAVTLTNIFLIEEKAQEANIARKWIKDVEEYSNYFEIPLHIRLNVLNTLSELDLTDSNDIVNIKKVLNGLITNSRVGNKPAHFYYDPELAARGKCVRLVNTLREHCQGEKFASDPRRMNCVAQIFEQKFSEEEQKNNPERSELWVKAEKAAQPNGAPPGFSPKATDAQHRAVITYLHAWTCDGRGTTTRLPLMQGYFASITAEVNKSLSDGRNRMERFKRHMVYSLGKVSKIEHSIWKVENMWRNLDAVFPGCIGLNRDFAAQPDGDGGAASQGPSSNDNNGSTKQGNNSNDNNDMGNRFMGSTKQDSSMGSNNSNNGSSSSFTGSSTIGKTRSSDDTTTSQNKRQRQYIPSNSDIDALDGGRRKRKKTRRKLKRKTKKSKIKRKIKRKTKSKIKRKIKSKIKKRKTKKRKTKKRKINKRKTKK
jgi:hypothetical protein